MFASAVCVPKFTKIFDCFTVVGGTGQRMGLESNNLSFDLLGMPQHD